MKTKIIFWNKVEKISHLHSAFLYEPQTEYSICIFSVLSKDITIFRFVTVCQPDKKTFNPFHSTLLLL